MSERFKKRNNQKPEQDNVTEIQRTQVKNKRNDENESKGEVQDNKNEME